MRSFLTCVVFISDKYKWCELIHIIVFIGQMQMPNVRPSQNVPSHQSWGPPPQGFPINAGAGPGFAPNPQYMQPSRQYENYYPPAEMPPMNNQHMQGPPMYGRDASVGLRSSSAQPQQPVVTKVLYPCFNLEYQVRI